MKATAVSTPLVKAIEDAWSAIQSNHDDVPDVVVTLGSGVVARGLKLGHFAANVWTHGEDNIHELFVGAEGLSLGASSLMATLLHEAAHAWAEANEIQDTSRQGRYHNDKFRMIGETFGLRLQKDPSIGWSISSLTDAAAEEYETAIMHLDLALTAYRRGPKLVKVDPNNPTTPAPVSPTGRTSNNNPVAARCNCGRRIRVSKTVLEMGGISCNICGGEFTA